jgi:FkbM family methyltransferase
MVLLENLATGRGDDTDFTTTRSDTSQTRFSRVHGMLRRLTRAVGGLLGEVSGWYMLGVEPFARRSTELVQVFSAGARYELDLGEFVQRKFYFRAYERRELRFVRSTLSAGDLFVDVGANVGLLSLCAARQVGEGGGVLAIEPAPENVDRLHVNVRLNPRSRVTVLPVAIGASHGTVRLGMPESQAGIQNSGARSSMSSENQIEVDLITIDDAVSRWSPGRDIVRLVKLDVEGMENEVVCGGPDLFGKRASCVMLEVNHRYGDDDLAVESLRRLGYDIYRLGVFARLRPWRTSQVPRSCVSSIARRLPAGIGPWISGEAKLTTAIAIRDTGD